MILVLLDISFILYDISFNNKIYIQNEKFCGTVVVLRRGAYFQGVKHAPPPAIITLPR
jgi:hypothetical protein